MYYVTYSRCKETEAQYNLTPHTELSASKMTHLAIAVIFFMSTVVFAEDWAAYLFSEISPSCRSRYQVERDMKQFSNCIEQKTEIFRNADTLEVDKFCEQLAVVMKPCLTNEKFTTIFEDPLNAIESGVDFACSYNGQPLQDFLDKGLPCIQSSFDIREKIKICAAGIPYHFKEEFLAFNSEENCGQVIDFSKCLIDVLNVCEDKTARNFFKDLSLTMLNKTPCKSFTHQLYTHTPNQLISTPTEALAPTWTINILLLAISASIVTILNCKM